MAIHVVWLKKDLRLFDHAPIDTAIKNAKEENSQVLLVYLFEPDIMNFPDYSSFHYQFIVDSLKDLNDRLKQFKTQISIHNENAIPFFKNFLEQFPKSVFYAHEEIGNGVSYLRDEKIRRFFKQKERTFFEFQTNGIIRGQWQKNWREQWLFAAQKAPIIPQYTATHFATVESTFDPEISQINSHLQQGGETRAHGRLKIFLDDSLKFYRKSIGSPIEAQKHCSRLSAHLAFGNITVRQIYRQTTKHSNYEKFHPQATAFIDRLLWHCHFIQRFEHFPETEIVNLNQAYNLVRIIPDHSLIELFKTGQTGFPFVDACIRCLNQTGYLNFRMRSMLISFFTHHMWQPWPEISHYLARIFLDYEPGIHYCQIQMQAGTMGIHTLRIYNPVLQGLEKDADAYFIKKWVPELSHLETAFIHEPWKLTAMESLAYNFTLGEDYPVRILDHEKSAEYARRTLWEIKNSEEVNFDAQKILKKRPR